MSWLKANPDKACEGTAGAGSLQHQGVRYHRQTRPAVRAKFADRGQEIFPRDRQTPAVLATTQKADNEKWRPIIKAAGIKVE